MENVMLTSQQLSVNCYEKKSVVLKNKREKETKMLSAKV